MMRMISSYDCTRQNTCQLAIAVKLKRGRQRTVVSPISLYFRLQVVVVVDSAVGNHKLVNWLSQQDPKGGRHGPHGGPGLVAKAGVRPTAEAIWGDRGARGGAREPARTAPLTPPSRGLWAGSRAIRARTGRWKKVLGTR
jgi:hypothetical protein